MIIVIYRYYVIICCSKLDYIILYVLSLTEGQDDETALTATEHGIRTPRKGTRPVQVFRDFVHQAYLCSIRVRSKEASLSGRKPLPPGR